MQFNGYNQAPTAQMNVLTNEEISQLMKKENSFSLALSETDKLRAACNHRRPDGLNDALYDDEDGAVRCSICGYKFRPIDANVNAAANIARKYCATLKFEAWSEYVRNIKKKTI